MAVITSTFVKGFTNHATVSWTGAATGDTFTEINLPKYRDKTIHVFGTFGTETVTIQGSNDPDKTVWSTLVDPQGNALTFTAAGIETILDNTLYIRPLISGGSGASGISIIISAGKTY